MIRLLGARKFIDMPAGTLYTEYWFNNIEGRDRLEECDRLIERFKKDPTEFLDTSDLMVYQQNGESLCLEGQKDQEDVVLTDINVVGDADPRFTLRVVFDLEDLPSVIKIRSSEYDEMTDWTKKELSDIIEIVKDYDFDKRNYNWAIGELNKLHKLGNKIIDVDIRANI